MVDKKEEQSADNQDEVVEEEKKSNKTFTQSEFDSKIGEIEHKYKLQLTEQAETKKKLEQLEKANRDRELSEMSEIEKSKKLIEEIQEKNKALEIEKSELLVKNLRNEVLSEKDFSILPTAYRGQVIGNTTEEIVASAKAQIEQYNKDFKDAKKSAGIPSNLGAGDQFSGNKIQSVAEKVSDSMRLKAEGKRF